MMRKNRNVAFYLIPNNLLFPLRPGSPLCWGDRSVAWSRWRESLVPAWRGRCRCRLHRSSGGGPRPTRRTYCWPCPSGASRRSRGFPARPPDASGRKKKRVLKVFSMNKNIRFPYTNEIHFRRVHRLSLFRNLVGYSTRYSMHAHPSISLLAQIHD